MPTFVKKLKGEAKMLRPAVNFTAIEDMTPKWS